MESNRADELTIIAEMRAAAADRLVTPWWYHPVLGALLGVYLVAFSLGGTVVRLVALVLFGAACAALVDVYRRSTGVWVNGLDAGPAGRWAKGLGLAVLVLMVVSGSLAYWTGLVWPVLGIAVVVFALTVVLGRRFDEALRAQLRAGA
ncbi:hypothetical protein KIH74_23650 [Kineosporia sp. J2-2]|uniref:Uncharacterized protein n=1 Tax=Kineosporia corallincola TaxID=2835133 RepID=A0ABS5TLI1_9ACTN|nr:hypothetical protein [Kineosporia corallincola]MBT0771957.1 hypothetical protein [Kineosporia corallincola]